MVLNIDQIAQDMGAEIVGEVPETGGGAFGAARISKVIGELNMSSKPVYTCLDGRLVFDGQCDTTRPFCGAVCCRKTIVLLTEEEKASTKYDYVEPTPNCNCQSCNFLRSKNSVALRRKEDGCIYLDGASQCSIYENRPAMCRNFHCETTLWNLVLPNAVK